MIFVATLLFIFVLGIFLWRQKEPTVTVYMEEHIIHHYPDEEVGDLTEDDEAMLRTLIAIHQLEETEDAD